jgi:hypothetical protein
MSQIGGHYRIVREMRGLSTDRTVESLSVISVGDLVEIKAIDEANRILTICHQDSMFYIFETDLGRSGKRIIVSR